MNLQAYALLINFLVALVAGFAILWKSRKYEALTLGVLFLSIAAWSICVYFLEIPNFPDGHQEFLYFGLIACIFLFPIMAAVAQFIFTLFNSNRSNWIRTPTLVLLGVIPLLTQIIFWATPQHGIQLGEQTGSLITFSSLWGRLNILYLYCLVGTCVLFSLDNLFHGFRSHRIQSGVLLISSLLPFISHNITFLGKNYSNEFMPSPLAFTVAALGFTYVLFSRRHGAVSSGLFNRDAVVEGMDDGWMVLDPDNNIVDINPAAERITGLVRDRVAGQPIASVLSDLPNLGQMFNGSQDLEVKRSVKSEAGWRYLNIRSSALSDPAHRQFGRLVVWRDITDRKLADDARQRARDEMFVLINAVSSAASNTLNLEDFLLESIYHIIYPFRSQVVGVFLLDERAKKGDEPRLFLASHFGFPPDAINDLSLISPTSPLFEWPYLERQPLQMEAPADDERIPKSIRDLALACFVIIPLITQAGDESKIIGFISLARKEKPVFSQDEIVRLTTISDQIATLIDSDRRRKLAIALSERQRLMRDLHDSVSQKLYGLVTTTEAAQAALEAGETVIPSEVLAKIGESARQAVKEMRLFLYQMQPIDVDKDGLISVLHHRLAAVEGRADIKARLLADDEITISKDKEIALYYIAQEALNNILRHAKAKSISVTLKQGRKNVILEIQDDGCGFDLKKVERGGLGLRNMRERTSQINGVLKISSKPDQGTTIVVTIRKDPSVKPIKRRR
jgi:PAS domain S-box-containing protein